VFRGSADSEVSQAKYSIDFMNIDARHDRIGAVTA